MGSRGRPEGGKKKEQTRCVDHRKGEAGAKCKTKGIWKRSQDKGQQEAKGRPAPEATIEGLGGKKKENEFEKMRTIRSSSIPIRKTKNARAKRLQGITILAEHDLEIVRKNLVPEENMGKEGESEGARRKGV